MNQLEYSNCVRSADFLKGTHAPVEYSLYSDASIVTINRCRTNLIYSSSLISDYIEMNYKFLILLFVSILCRQPISCQLGHTTPLLVSQPHRPISSLGQGTPHGIKIALRVSGENVTLNLVPNQDLLHTNYAFQHIDTNGHIVSQSGVATPCHYTGHVECVGCRDTRAFVSTCQGELRGLFTFNHTDHFIEPFSGSDSDAHFVYTQVADPATHSEVVRDTSESLGQVARSKLRSVRSYAIQNRRYYLEALVAVDGTMVSHHGSATESYALTIMNIVAGLLAQPSIGQTISLVVSRLVTTSPGPDTFHWHRDTPELSLSTFCEWQHRINGTHDLATHDMALLLTRRSLCPPSAPCSVVGLANRAGLCHGQHSCLVVRDTGLMLAGTTVTHEMGHLLGSYHDENSGKCVGYATSHSSYIMTQVFTSATNHFTWSECSKHSIADFLSRGGDACLLNKPTNQIALSSLPLSADDQCRTVLGADSRAVPAHSTCGALACHQTPSANRWLALPMPMLDGTRCSINSDTEGECASGICVRKGNRDLPIDGKWAGWQGWSDCAHSCGLSLRHRERTCGAPAPSHGGAVCLGDRRQYATCQVAECPPSLPSRRDRQCQTVMWNYDGTWLALSRRYRVSSPCGLFCQRQETQGIVSLPPVEDGTECHGGSPKAGMCLLGNCVRVDCSGELGGGATLDECGVCGGDGTSCHIVSGTLREYLPSLNLHRLLSIPPGARKVTLTNLTPLSSLHLVLTQSGKSVLIRPNGNLRINGVAWRSATLANGSDTFSTPGPVSDSLQLKVLGGPSQVALSYSYTLPLEQVVSLASEMAFHWVAGSLCHSCNATCGTAVKECVAQCVDASNYPVSHLLCDQDTKPLNTSLPCDNLPRCPTYLWSSSGWGPCSATCGSGHKTRHTLCFARTDLNYQLAHESKCVPGTRPKSSLPCWQKCPTSVPPTQSTTYIGVWGSDTWSECPAQNCLPPGAQQLVPECRLEGVKVDPLHCDPATRPAPQQRECQKECIKWEVRPWKSCEKNCRRRRPVRCLRNGQKVAAAICATAKLAKPRGVQKCHNCNQ